MVRRGDGLQSPAPAVRPPASGGAARHVRRDTVLLNEGALLIGTVLFMLTLLVSWIWLVAFTT